MRFNADLSKGSIMRVWGLLVAASVVATTVAPFQFSIAAESAAVAVAETPTAQAMVDDAIKFLRTSQADDGSFSKQAGPGVTAIVVTGLLENGVPASDPMVAKALDYLQTFIRSDG